MKLILEAAIELAALVSPSKVEALASRLIGVSLPVRDQDLQQTVGTPVARVALGSLIEAWRTTALPGDVIAGILMGAAHARQKALREFNAEFVWTGPTTPYVAPRRTEQVLLDVINRASKELFVISFVAYDVASVITALNSAIDRGVDTRILVEASMTQGGSLLVDPVATMRSAVPMAKLYVWTDRPHPFTNGRVHAKVAVADDTVAFVTSANLTGHALEKNIEAGVLLTGGNVPSNLRNHFHALINTKVIRPT